MEIDSEPVEVSPRSALITRPLLGLGRSSVSTGEDISVRFIGRIARREAHYCAFLHFGIMGPFATGIVSRIHSPNSFPE